MHTSNWEAKARRNNNNTWPGFKESVTLTLNSWFFEIVFRTENRESIRGSFYSENIKELKTKGSEILKFSHNTPKPEVEWWLLKFF